MASWKTRIINILDRLGGPEFEWEKIILDDSKPYIQNALKELAKAAFPSLKLFPIEGFTARKLGGLAGHQLAYIQNLGAAMELHFNKFKSFAQGPAMLKLAQDVNELRAKASESRTESAMKALRLSENFLAAMPELEQALAELRTEIPEYRSKTMSAVRRCLKIAMDQEVSECREFFLGFAKALETGSLTKYGTLVGMTSATTIYFLIVIFGEELKRMLHNVNQFHALLTLYFGHNLAGDLARTQKLCNRIELHFGKPGRPRKIKIRTRQRKGCLS